MSFKVVVQHNGIGLLKDTDLKTTKSLGLRLVTILAEEQLHGHAQVDIDHGTTFRNQFRAE